MNGNDLLAIVVGVSLLVLDWLWEHRNGVATLIALAVLVGIMNNLQAIAAGLQFIERVIKERFPERETDEEDEGF
jgi:hypothetical protein